MSDWPKDITDISAFGLLSTAGEGSPVEEVGANLTGGSFAGITNWPVANLALYTPVLVRRQTLVYQLGWHISGPSGNVDVGIYDKTGARLISTGSTAMASGTQTVDVADTTLPPGLYYLAMAIDNASANIYCLAMPVPAFRISGCAEQVSAFPLPSSATFAASGRSLAPLIFGSIQQAAL